MSALKTLADVRAKLGSDRVTVKALADEMGMSYGRCSTLINGDPLVELTEDGAREFGRALDALNAREGVAA